jgi:transcription elongation factor S-II
MYTIPNGTLFRKNIKEYIKSRIYDLSNSTSNAMLYYISYNIETSIFNYTIRECELKRTIKKWENSIFVELYINKLRSIYINLSNPYIITNLLAMNITPQSLAFMTHQELNPDMWKSLIELKCKKDESKFNTVIQPSTDVYVCRKCKSRKCTYSAQQTRSSDEPMTIYVSCLNCGKNWAC